MTRLAYRHQVVLWSLAPSWDTVTVNRQRAAVSSSLFFTALHLTASQPNVKAHYLKSIKTMVVVHYHFYNFLFPSPYLLDHSFDFTWQVGVICSPPIHSHLTVCRLHRKMTYWASLYKLWDFSWQSNCCLFPLFLMRALLLVNKAVHLQFTMEPCNNWREEMLYYCHWSCSFTANDTKYTIYPQRYN